MADEKPPTTPQDEAGKSETVRITLPTKSDGPVAKRETVRVNIPEPSVQPPPQAPKKETSKVVVAGSGIMPPSAPRPPGAPMAPSGAPPLRPLSGAVPPPKPPPLSSKPTVPLKPAPPVPQSAIAPKPASGIVAKPASPKKETARISLPTDASKGGGPALPKATVKMQQTQPLSKAQPSGVRPAATTVTSIASAPVVSSSPAQADTLSLVLSIVALVGAAAALAAAFFAYQAATLPSWVQ